MIECAMLPNSLFDIASPAKAGSASQAQNKQNARNQKPAQGFEPILEAAREAPANRGVKDAPGKGIPPHKYVKPAQEDKAQEMRATYPDKTDDSARLRDKGPVKPAGDVNQADTPKTSKSAETKTVEKGKTDSSCENPAEDDAAINDTETGDAQASTEAAPSTAIPSEATMGETAEAMNAEETGVSEGAQNENAMPEAAANGQTFPLVTPNLTPNIPTDLAGLEAGAGTEKAEAATLQGQGAVALLTAATQLEAAQSTAQKTAEIEAAGEDAPEAGTFESAGQDGLETATSALPKGESSASTIKAMAFSATGMLENAGGGLAENNAANFSKAIDQNANPAQPNVEKAGVLNPEAKNGASASVPQIGSRLAAPDQIGAERFSDIVDAPYGLRGLGDIAQTMDRILLDKAQAGAAAQHNQHLRPTPLQMLPIEIGMQALRGTNSFQIRLDPAELGRVDVKLEVNKQGEVSAHLIVERPETLQMLRRDSTTLQYAFEQAGLKSSQDGLSFSLKGEGQNGQQQSQNGSAPGREEDEQAALKAQIEHLSLRRMMIPNSSIDRVI